MLVDVITSETNSSAVAHQKIWIAWSLALLAMTCAIPIKLFGRLKMRNLGPHSSRLAADWRLGQPCLPALHDECVFERIPRRFYIRSLGTRLIVANVIADEMASDAVLDVGFDMLVVGHVQL